MSKCQLCPGQALKMNRI